MGGCQDKPEYHDKDESQDTCEYHDKNKYQFHDKNEYHHEYHDMDGCHEKLEYHDKDEYQDTCESHDKSEFHEKNEYHDSLSAMRSIAMGDSNGDGSNDHTLDTVGGGDGTKEVSLKIGIETDD